MREQLARQVRVGKGAPGVHEEERVREREREAVA